MKITERMIQSLAKEYPGKKIIRIPEKNPKEVICEIAGAPDGSWSVAVALIVKSVPHYHEKTFEAYRVLKGKVRLMNSTKNGKILTSGFQCNDWSPESESGGIENIPLNHIHCAWAIGRFPAKVLVVASPAWRPDDHHLCPKIKPFDFK